MPVVTWMMYRCLYIFISHTTVLFKWTFKFEIWIDQKSHNPAIKFPRVDWSRERSARLTNKLHFFTRSHLIFLVEVNHLLELKYVHFLVSLYPLWRVSCTYSSNHVQISTPAKWTCFGCRFTSESAPLQKGHGLAVDSSPNQHPNKMGHD